MKHVVPHDLGPERAKKVAVAAFTSYMQKLAKYSPRTDWISDRRANISFSVKGMTLRGAVEVKDSSIEMELDVPFLFRPFQGKAMSLIDAEIREWMAKARDGDV